MIVYCHDRNMYSLIIFMIMMNGNGAQVDASRSLHLQARVTKAS